MGESSGVESKVVVVVVVVKVQIGIEIPGSAVSAAEIQVPSRVQTLSGLLNWARESCPRANVHFAPRLPLGKLVAR